MKKIEKPENYEGMTPEEKLRFFENFEYEDNAEVVKNLKDSVSRASSQAAEWKRKHNALLSEDEQAKFQREEEVRELTEKLDAVNKELDEVKKGKQISDYTAKYTALGYDSTLAESTAKALVKGDVITVLANQATFNEKYAERIKAEMLKDTPKPKTGNSSEKISKETFDNMSYSEKVKLYETDKELYDNLNGGN